MDHARAPSFRDPGGSLHLVAGRVLRVLNQAGAADYASFSATPGAELLRQAGQIVGTTTVPAEEVAALLPAGAVQATSVVLEHERISFPSFPHEWPAEMLLAAGELTLEIALGVLEYGLGLKDATPYNVLFRGTDPVLVDVLSIEKRDPLDPIWLAEAQFERTFLLPLLAYSRFGLSMGQVFLEHRDGLEPEQLYQFCGPLQRLAPTFLRHVTLPVWLGRRQRPGASNVYRPRRVRSAEQAEFTLRLLFRSLRSQLGRLRKRCAKISHWSAYAQDNSYSAPDLGAKSDFVETVLRRATPQRVLDIGCNTGHFSLLAARAGASVVAIDRDPAVVGALWRAARSDRLDVLPLVVDISRPVPALGWENRESPGFLDRACGQFDGVLMLGLLHHLVISERVPLTAVLQLAHQLTRSWVLIEYVGREDPMFRHLSRGRERFCADFTLEAFHAAREPLFEVSQSLRLHDSDRSLYLLHKRRG